MEGKGEKVNQEGDHYIGEFRNDQYEGNGELIFRENHLGKKYSGHFKEGRIEGNGYYQWKDGSKYKGEFRNHIINGNG